MLNEIFVFLSKNIFGPLSSKETTSTLDAELSILHSECMKRRSLFDTLRKILQFNQKKRTDFPTNNSPSVSGDEGEHHNGDDAIKKWDIEMADMDFSSNVVIKRYLETSSSIFSSIFQKQLKQLINGVTVVRE